MSTPARELRRRQKQLETLRAMRERAREEQDVERGARIEASMIETAALIEALAAPSSESGGEAGRRRRS